MKVTGKRNDNQKYMSLSKIASSYFTMINITNNS